MSFYRLKSGCELLIFQHPKEFGRKAEELLWRKVFYEVIQKLKQYKRVSFAKSGAVLLVVKESVKMMLNVKCIFTGGSVSYVQHGLKCWFLVI